jgi:Na+-transporting methylmalonyl-CoA/oxaloacetate decarboxylase gamma subunit
MDPVQFALKAMVFGMGTVFTCLVLLQGTMYTTARLLNPAPKAPAGSAKGQDYSKVQLSDPPLAAVAAEGDLPVSAEMVAAAILALHMDRLAHEELEAQRLTWTAMFKPFSPWLMDSKNSLHTHRIRYRAVGGVGTIVRDRAARN